MGEVEKIVKRRKEVGGILDEILECLAEWQRSVVKAERGWN
jgi:hypothetical protein